jgi:predicted amidohydrolase
MKAGFYKYDVKNGDKECNLDRINVGLANHSFDLLVLPELCTSGYLFASREEALEHSEAVPNGITTKTLERISKEKNAYIAGGVLERDENDKLYNTAVLTGPSGYLGKYRKIHLSALEAKIFERGSELCLFDIGEYKIGILICFDLWYPEICRTLMFSGADLICCPSNFGGSWSINFAKIRALENLTYFITCNRTGEESKNDIIAQFCGESHILDYTGQAFYHAGANEEAKFWELEIKTKEQRDFVLAKDIYRDVEMYRHKYKQVY